MVAHEELHRLNAGEDHNCEEHAKEMVSLLNKLDAEEQKVQKIENIFWTMVKEDFAISDDSSIGIREGYQVTTIEKSGEDSILGILSSILTGR